ALGSDTGGSVRCPASFCGVVGLKPTYGLVSRYGLIAYANSLEQIGPLAKDVYDCALLLSIIGGEDPRDMTSIKIRGQDYTKFLNSNTGKLRIGIPKEFLGEGTHEEVKKSVSEAVSKLEELGFSSDEVSIPTLKYALPAYYLIAMSEASSNLARYDGLRYGYRCEDKGMNWNEVYSQNRRLGFGPEVRRRIILGTYALSAGYYDEFFLKALKVATLIKKDFNKAFKQFDVLVGPTMPIPPFQIGEKIQDPISLYMCDIDTVPVNLAGIPAISVPCGYHNGLPIGVQFIAPSLREDIVLKTAYLFEQNFPYCKDAPKL
ncbi:MAG: amidase family protein, partial [Candidatus Bathyarchaeota archaeon]